MMTLHWKQGSDKLDIWHNDSERSIPCSCLVRNEVNGWRKVNQVVYSIPDQQPCQPRIFPAGKWTIGKPLPRRHEYTAPYFIPTNAAQDLPIWKVKDGHYVHETAKRVHDAGYGLHFSSSNTTLGCIKITNLDDLVQLVDDINYMIYNKIYPVLIVEE